MDTYDFEEFVPDLWKAQGWGVRVPQDSRGMGVDILAATSEQVFEQHHALRDQENVDAVVVVISSRPSDDAEDWANVTQRQARR